jgi:hypothetical protein
MGLRLILMRFFSNQQVRLKFICKETVGWENGRRPQGKGNQRKPRFVCIASVQQNAGVTAGFFLRSRIPVQAFPQSALVFGVGLRRERRHTAFVFARFAGECPCSRFFLG